MKERTSVIDLPLHRGKCPAWLFDKMMRLSRNIFEVIISEYGKEEVLRRLSNGIWFQSLGCILGFDWHSSGLTTTVCGALKEAFKDLKDLGVYICGGKGKTSLKTPQEIENICWKLGKNPNHLIYASKITAKVDNNALQDGFQLYHNTFIFTDNGKWCVIQQGMSQKQEKWARRYHWLSEDTSSFVSEPHKMIISDKSFFTLNMVAKEAEEARKLCKELSLQSPDKTIYNLEKIRTYKLPYHHKLLLQDINKRYLNKVLLKTYAKRPKDFEELLSLEGVGAKTIRALALISELIYGAKLSFKDPAIFSFAHGGKDGYPYKINPNDYEKSISILEKAINKAKIDHSDKVRLLKKLYNFYSDDKRE